MIEGPNQHAAKAVDIKPVITTLEARRKAYDAQRQEQNQHCLLLAQSLKEAETTRDASAALVAELSEQIAYLNGLPAATVGGAPPASDTAPAQ